MGNENSKPENNYPSGKVSNPFNLLIDDVDRLADELATAYSNPKYRQWYCKIIYQFGPEQVHHWMARAAKAEQPGIIFSKLASEACKKNPGDVDKYQASVVPKRPGDGPNESVTVSWLEEALNQLNIEPMPKKPYPGTKKWGK